MATITLQSSDGQKCEVDVEIAKESGTIKTMLDDLGYEGDQEGEVCLQNNMLITPLNYLIMNQSGGAPAQRQRQDPGEGDRVG